MGLRGGTQCGVYNVQMSGVKIVYAPQNAVGSPNYSGFDARNRDELLVKIFNDTQSGVKGTLFGATFDDANMNEEVYDSDANSGVTVNASGIEMFHTDVNYAYSRMMLCGTVAGISGIVKVVFQPDSHGRV